MRLFRIYVDGALFYHPHLSKLAVTKAEVKEDAENIDSLTLSAPYNHPYLAAIRPMASAIVTALNNRAMPFDACLAQLAVLGEPTTLEEVEAWEFMPRFVHGVSGCRLKSGTYRPASSPFRSNA